jgi:uncharacterized protein (TIGR02996 family)
MHDEAGFLSAIREAPADDTARLVFADWLDEQDDPACQPKAAFIRLELRMAEAPGDAPNRTESLAHLRSLAVNAPHSWLAVVSHVELEGCQQWHRNLTCPGRWELLSPTSFDDIRRCGECKKAVRFCSLISHARPWAQDGNGVAISPAVERQPGDLPLALTPEMIERLRTASARCVLSLPSPPPPPAPAAPLWVPQPEDRARVRRRPKRKKGRHRHRNVQRDNWEDAE